MGGWVGVQRCLLVAKRHVEGVAARATSFVSRLESDCRSGFIYTFSVCVRALSC